MKTVDVVVDGPRINYQSHKYLVSNDGVNTANQNSRSTVQMAVGSNEFASDGSIKMADTVEGGK